MQNEKIIDNTSIDRASKLLKETQLLQTVKSANILIDIFGFDKAFKRIKPKREGQQIEMYFPALEGSITMTLTSKRADFKAVVGKPNNPVSRIIINEEIGDTNKSLSKILVLKDNLFGLMKILPRMVKGKIKVEGSLVAAILLNRCMMIGKHEMYKGQL